MEKLNHTNFKKVFKQYYNPLCNYASNILDDRKSAQDVVQDVFTKLWSSKKEIEIKENFKNYLFVAVKHRALEVLRKKKVEAKVINEQCLTDDADVESIAQQYLLKEQLHRSIKQLPPKCQEIFIYNKINGLTYNEIAVELNISVRTVENQIGKAYRKLREMMANSIVN